MKILMGKQVAVSESFYKEFITCENAHETPFELKFDERKVEAFNYGEKCFETSNDFNRFEKVVLTVTAKNKGKLNASEYYHGNLIKSGFGCGDIFLGSGDRVEVTITQPTFNGKVQEDFPFNGYNVYIWSTAEIEDIQLDFGKYTKVVDVPVEELKLNNEVERVIIVCEYCLHQKCTCGAENWVILELPRIKLY